MAARTRVNTVCKHICTLADKGLVSTEDTVAFTKNGLKHNDSLLCTIRPIKEVLDIHHQSQLEELGSATAGWEYAKTASLQTRSRPR